VDDVFGSGKNAQKKYFDDGGEIDRICQSQ
jgi:ABC-type sulfate transport system substrate-binding protein